MDSDTTIAALNKISVHIASKASTLYLNVIDAKGEYIDLLKVTSVFLSRYSDDAYMVVGFDSRIVPMSDDNIAELLQQIGDYTAAKNKVLEEKTTCYSCCMQNDNCQLQRLNEEVTMFVYRCPDCYQKYVSLYS